MPGIGNSPFGTVPFGVGAPTAAASQGGKPLTNPSTGVSTGSRFLDPKTGDYVVDGFGRISGMDDLRQLVLLRVKTTQGASTVAALGNTLRSIDRITSNIERRIDAILRSAVRDIVDGGLIEVVSVTANVVRPGVVLAQLRWRSVATGLEDSASIPLTR